MDKLIDDYRVEFSNTKKHVLAKKIQQLLHDEAYILPLWAAPYVRTGYWRYVKFPKHFLPKPSKDPFNYLFHGDWGGMFWIDEDSKKETLAAVKSGKTFEPVDLILTKYKNN